MTWILIAAGGVAGGLLLAGLALRFRLAVRAVESRLLAAPLPGAGPLPDLPPLAQHVAYRARAGEGGPVRAVRLVQAAEMQLGEGKPWQALSARQIITVARPGFAWVARQSPIPVVTVLDAFDDGRGQLRARLLGGTPVADATGDALDLGEAMRYLAELPWAPDAILFNPAIGWQVGADGWLEARLPVGNRVALVRMRTDAAGDIVEITASGRPARLPDGSTALMDWRGVFSDHADMGGRRIPLAGEVGYVTEGRYRPYWRGRITGYELLR